MEDLCMCLRDSWKENRAAKPLLAYSNGIERIQRMGWVEDNSGHPSASISQERQGVPKKELLLCRGQVPSL